MTGWGWPLTMAFVRLPLALLAAAAVLGVYRVAGYRVGFEAGLVWAPFTFTIVNLVCLAVLVRLTRAEGVRLADLLGYRRDRLRRDLGEGVLLAVVLGALLVIGVVLGGLVLYGAQVFTRFETAFVGGAGFTAPVPAWLAVVSALTFPIVNPVVEELQYRGYAQPRLIAAFGATWLGIGVTALGFALQHVAFALTAAGAFIYPVGFLLWGLGAGIVAHRRRRLMPLVVAHAVSNLSFAVIPVIVLVS